MDKKTSVFSRRFCVFVWGVQAPFQRGLAQWRSRRPPRHRSGEMLFSAFLFAKLFLCACGVKEKAGKDIAERFSFCPLSLFLLSQKKKGRESGRKERKKKGSASELTQKKLSRSRQALLEIPFAKALGGAHIKPFVLSFSVRGFDSTESAGMGGAWKSFASCVVGYFSKFMLFRHEFCLFSLGSPGTFGEGLGDSAEFA